MSHGPISIFQFKKLVLSFLVERSMLPVPLPLLPASSLYCCYVVAVVNALLTCHPISLFAYVAVLYYYLWSACNADML